MLALSDFLLEHGQHHLGYLDEETVAIEDYEELKIPDTITV